MTDVYVGNVRVAAIFRGASLLYGSLGPTLPDHLVAIATPEGALWVTPAGALYVMEKRP